MKVYKFIFMVGLLNLVVPFLGIPFIYKNYALITLAVITLGYALVVRAVEKERQFIKKEEAFSISKEDDGFEFTAQKTIEEVVDMVEEKPHIIMSDVVIKRRGRKPKVTQEQLYE